MRLGEVLAQVGLLAGADDAGAERQGQAGHVAADGAEADDADGDLAHLACRQRLPGALALQLDELRQPAHHRQDHHHRVLGDGLAEDATGVGDGQAALRPRRA